MATVIDDELEEALRKRLTAGVERFVQISREAGHLADALATPNEVEFFGFITNELASHADPDLEGLAKAKLAAARFREKISNLTGGLLSATNVADFLDQSSAAVYRAATERRLIFVDDNGRKLFPRFQFEDGLREPITKILKACPASSGWEIVQFLFGRPEGLGGAQPIELLRTGTRENLDTVLKFARATLEE